MICYIPSTNNLLSNLFRLAIYLLITFKYAKELDLSDTFPGSPTIFPGLTIHYYFFCIHLLLLLTIFEFSKHIISSGMVIKTFCPKLVPAFQCNDIPIVWVDSPYLSAAFYREYLGFKVILKKSRGKGDEILVNRKGNLIWLKPLMNSGFTEKEVNNQIVTIYSKAITNDYESVKEKVRITSSFNAKVEDRFSVIDCNGIEIVFKGSLKTDIK